ncbi:M23 family metallopeptidase [Candidatus Haliotispira prima]|uniref:M23 family metallopeptidase n=1 Tax=Candidatus Haliotispira prima TaxID=3034016 RepID=A0ABY8MG29_9SPIO|nr:M23 family metallopeptidase [Candidatus Haliotispira prima]
MKRGACVPGCARRAETAEREAGKPWVRQSLGRGFGQRFRQGKCLPVLGLLLLAWCLSAQLSAQKLYAPDRVGQGRILQSFIYPVRNSDSVEFTLLNSQGKVVARSRGFLLNYERGTLVKKLDGRMKDWVTVGLLGITSTQESGNYILRATIAKKKSRSQLLERPIYIRKHEFPGETIKVSAKMNSVLNPKDPDLIARQRTQSNELWAILKNDNPEYLFYNGALLRPLEDGQGRTSSAYGYVRKYVYPGGKTVNSVHKGYDIAAAQGIHILASGDGLVVMAKDRIVTGKTVMIAVLPGIFLKYQHMSVISVTEGSSVKRGDLIGEVGRTGFATGNHVHTELWVSARRVDPSLYFNEPLIDTNRIISMIAAN